MLWFLLPTPFIFAVAMGWFYGRHINVRPDWWTDKWYDV